MFLANTPDAAASGWPLTLRQPQYGYRFSLDAFLLADFVPSMPHMRQPILDVGTGCGVIALLLARRFDQARLLGIELQSELVACARQNIVCNGLAHRVNVIRADARTLPSLMPAGSCGVVVCNPPYRRAGQGRPNPNASKAVARHEIALTLSQLVTGARHALARRGLLVMIYHPSRLAELCVELERAHLGMRRLRLIHPQPHTPASMALVEAVCEGRDALEVLPPLLVCDAHGKYTDEMQAIFQGRGLGGRDD